jgi:hypothetical protein
MTKQTKIRAIVRAAFKCDALDYQFSRIDVEDGLLDGSNVVADVNEKYSDATILGEAENRLDICNDLCNQDDPDYRRDARQLRAFIKRFSKAAA